MQSARRCQAANSSTHAEVRPIKVTSSSLVGMDMHKDSIAIAVAEAGWQTPRFIGTVVVRLPWLQRRCEQSTRAKQGQPKPMQALATPLLRMPRVSSSEGWNKRFQRNRVVRTIRGLTPPISTGEGR